MIHINIHKNHCFPEINNESVLQQQIVNYLKETDLLFTIAGDNLATSQGRVDSLKHGYTCGTPDLLILTPCSGFNGLAIEIKTPKGLGSIQKNQLEFLEKISKECNYFSLVSNNLFEILEVIIKYYSGILQ